MFAKDAKVGRKRVTSGTTSRVASSMAFLDFELRTIGTAKTGFHNASHCRRTSSIANLDGTVDVVLNDIALNSIHQLTRIRIEFKEDVVDASASSAKHPTDTAQINHIQIPPLSHLNADLIASIFTLPPF